MSVPQKPRVDEDEDLDDLDDVLDQFSPQAQPASSAPQPTSASASTSAQPAHSDKALTEDDFAAKLEKGMESLFRDIGINPSTAAGLEGPDEAREREQLTAAWEAMLTEGMNAISGPSTVPPGPKEDDFQSRIRSTMNKLKESESDLQSSDPSASSGDDTFESLLSQLQGMGLGDVAGNGEESEEQLQGVLEAMMGQLMRKDVLYEPLKELYSKFPEYITKNNSTISPEDKKRFEAQISCIKQLLFEFDAKTYRDDDEKTREKIVGLMGELQTYGSPPEEIMGPLPAGFSMGADGLPNMPDGCNMN